MSTSLKRTSFVAILFAVAAVAVLSRPSALDPGSSMPPIEAAGWTNGEMPDLNRKIVVLEVFATW